MTPLPTQPSHVRAEAVAAGGVQVFGPSSGGSWDEATIGVAIAFQKVGAVDVFEYACALQVTKCGSLPARKGGKFGLLPGALQQMML